MKTSYTMFQTLLGKLEDGESFSHANDRRASWVGPVNRSENSGFWANWREGNITHVPWNCVHLDDDLVEAMSIWSKVPGRFVEFGCGSGMASARLAALGYSVVGIDLSKANIELACRSYEAQNERLEYHVWDVTKPMESFGVFDYGFDRGCFHQLPHDKRERYVENVYDIMRPGGRLFLKTFSRSEPGSWGPSRFSSHEIASIFASKFLIVEQSPSCFESRLTHQPKALFSVLKRL